MGHSLFFGSSRKVGEANKGLGEAPKSCTRKEHESATNSIAKRGQGAIAPCRVKGQRPLWGLGQRPNSSTGDQYAKRAQQRCRQRSVPASNSALPQERPQAALPQDSVKNRKNPHEKSRHVLPLTRMCRFLFWGIVCPSDTTCYFCKPQRRRRITSSATSSVAASALLTRFISLRL